MGTLQEALKSANLVTDKQLEDARRKAERTALKEKRIEFYEGLLSKLPAAIVPAVRVGRNRNPKLFSNQSLKELVKVHGFSKDTTLILGNAAGSEVLREAMARSEELFELMAALNVYALELLCKQGSKESSSGEA